MPENAEIASCEFYRDFFVKWNIGINFNLENTLCHSPS